MNIQEVMDTELLTVAPEITLREAAQRMSGRNVGAALLLDAAIGSYLGIIFSAACSTPSQRATTLMSGA